MPVVIALVVLWFLLLGFLVDLPNSLRWPARMIWLTITLGLSWWFVQVLRHTDFTRKKLLFIAVLGLLYWLLLTLVCQGFIKIVSGRDDRLSPRGMTTLPAPCREGIEALIAGDKFPLFDRDIGWVPRPGYTQPNGLYGINSQGVRGKGREYAIPVPDVAKRVLCVGDSFTFGVAVKDEDCYPAQAEKLQPGTEWINLGIPGGCLAQACQRYVRDAPVFGGRRVVIGFMSNDAQRTVNAFRPLLNIDSGCPFTKPFAKLTNGTLSIEMNPFTSIDDYRHLLANETAGLARLTQLDYLTWSAQGRRLSAGPISRTLLYGWETCGLDRGFHAMLDSRIPGATWFKSLIPSDPYGRSIWDKDSPGFKTIVALFAYFHQKVVADGRTPLFVLMPGPSDVQDLRHRFPCQYASLATELSERKLPFIDFLPVIARRHKHELTTDALFTGNHYRPEMNKELASEIIKALP